MYCAVLLESGAARCGILNKKRVTSRACVSKVNHSIMHKFMFKNTVIITATFSTLIAETFASIIYRLITHAINCVLIE
jgi:hypothetical protein